MWPSATCKSNEELKTGLSLEERAPLMHIIEDLRSAKLRRHIISEIKVDNGS
jgi:hypothetical protein